MSDPSADPRSARNDRPPVEARRGWTIHAGTAPFRPSERQRELLGEVQRIIASARRGDDHRQILEELAPLVAELARTGMTRDQIADHSRIRPQGVAAILEGDEPS
ncbi:hypothetical protein [Microbacterium sp. KNMS]